MGHVGELAALATAGCWTLTALFFEAAGRRIGALTVNLVRLVIAFALLAVVQWVARGLVLPTDASQHAWVWLGISGWVGVVFGDLCLFRAFIVLGPRLSTLMMALAPPMTAVMGWIGLGEVLDSRDLIGMSLTVGGVALAILERGAPTGPRSSPTLVGVLLGLGGALGQAGGLVLSKYGMGSYDPLAATQIRLLAGLVGFAAIFTVWRWWPRVTEAVRNRPAMGYTTAGAIFGPFLGISLSLIAVQHTETGVAASIMATSPILIIPVVVFIKKERVGPFGIAGAIIAVAGVALLFS